jgi:CcdB protein
MKSVYDLETTKKATNVTVNTNLLGNGRSTTKKQLRNTPQYVDYENLNKDSRKLYPYLIDIQSNHLEDLETTTVIPLTKIQTVTKKFTKLTPQFRHRSTWGKREVLPR